MTHATSAKTPLIPVLGILALLALTTPVSSFAETATPPNSIGIPSSTEQIIERGRGNHFGRPGHTGGQEPVQPVPEPGTMAMMAMGVVALGATLRKRFIR